jgi:hypothetical protein
MIFSTTPDKLAEIIRDTWPGLYRPPVRKPQQDQPEINVENANAAYTLQTLPI